MSKQYKLVKLTDLFEIPEDRLDTFLPELKEWIILAKRTDEMLREVSAAINEPYATDGGMTWIDDGKTDMKITLTPAKVTPNPKGEK